MTNKELMEVIAQRAVAMADAMLRELESQA